MDVQETSDPDKGTTSPTPAPAPHTQEVLAGSTEDDILIQMQKEIDEKIDGVDEVSAASLPANDNNTITPIKEKATGEKEPGAEEGKAGYNESENNNMVVSQDPHLDDDAMEEHMANVAQTANAAHQIRLQELTEKKTGRSTAGQTTSFMSQGSFSTGKSPDPTVNAVLNNVLDSFNELMYNAPIFLDTTSN